MKSGRRFGKVFAFALLFATLAFVSIGYASAATHYVDPGESIQAAVDAADPGDTIIVRDGTYTENINVYKRLTIFSENGSASTIVQAANSSKHVFNVPSDYVNISGFTVTGATDGAKGGIYLNNADHCNISDNIAYNNFYGIWLKSSGNNTLSGNYAYDNSQYGIRLYNSSNNTLSGNYPYNNSCHGIWLESSSNNTLSGNDAYNNSKYGISLSSSSNNTLSGNNAYNNSRHGIRLEFSSNNTLSGNDAYNNSCHGIRLYNSSNYNTLSGNNAYNNSGGIHLESSSNYNNLSGNNAYNNSGHGIRLSSSSNYNTLTDNTVNSNTEDGIELSSSSNSTLSGNNAYNNSDHGIFLYSSNNYNNLSGNNAYNNSGYGIFLHSSSNYNNLSGNNAYNNSGHGIRLYSSSNNNLSGNDAYNNSGHGIFLDSSSNNSLSGNNAYNNSGGICLESSSNNNLTGNTVSDNSQHGICLSSSSNYNTLTNNTVNSNAEDGIELSSSSNYNTLTNNTANSNNNYGISLSSSSSNTLTNNTANSNSQRGIFLYSSSNNNLTGNNAYNNSRHGIRLYSSSNNNLSGNNAYNNSGHGIRLDSSSNYNNLSGNNAYNNSGGISLESSSNNNLTGNTVSDNSQHGICLGSSSNNTLTNNTVNSNTEDGISLSSSSNYNTLTNNTVNSNNEVGICLYSSSNNTLSGNNAYNNSGGIWLESSNNYNNLSGNNAYNNSDHGIFLYSSNNYNNLSGNNAYNNSGYGIFLHSSSNYNNLSGNNAYNNSGHGIRLYSSSNNNISGNTAYNNSGHGIFLDSSSNNTLSGNNAYNNSGGIVLSSSSNNNLTGNTVSDNSQHGICLGSSSNNTLTNNTVNSNTEDGISLSSSSNNNLLGNNAYNNSKYGIFLYNSSNNTLSGNDAHNNFHHGIHLEFSSNNTLSGNDAYNNSCHGIRLHSSSNYNNLSGNNAYNNSGGIVLDSSSNNNNLSGNNAYNNSGGISLESSSNNNLTGNTVSDNSQQGICLRDSSNNTLTSNTANSNGYKGINLRDSNNNLIYNNYFNNMNNAYDNGNNIWNITKTAGTNIVGGPHLGGNYWSDYAGEDLDGDGLGDTLLPYNSSGDIQNGGDWHPLVFKPAKTIYVPDDYPTIQAAVNNATAGDTIIVKDGTYTENVNVNVNHLTIQSENGSASTIVQAANPDDHVLEITADYVNISEFTVENARTENYTAGIYLGGVEYCDISDNVCNNNSIGTYLNSTHNSVMDNNSISNCGVGIGLVNSNLNNVTNNEVSNANWGISLWQSNFNSVINNTIFNTTTIETQYAPVDAMGVAIQIMDSRNNLVDNNTILNTTALQTNAYAYGIFVISYGGGPADNNTIANNEIYHTTGPGEAGIGIGICVMANNNKLFNNNASFNELGIMLRSSSYTRIEGNYVGANQLGMFIVFSDNNTFANNTASNNAYPGIGIYASNNNTVINNTVNSNNGVGISLGESNGNRIIDNIANENSAGIELEGSSNHNIVTNNAANKNDHSGIQLFQESCNNTVTGNTANENSDHGISLENSSNNLIYNNYFNNANNAYDDGNNIWNIAKTAGTNIVGGPYLGGNYWSDYVGEDLNGDRLGDTLLPYNSSGNIQNGGDGLPLVIQSASISGRVCEADGCTPIEGATVKAGGWDVMPFEFVCESTTDTNGTYVITNLSAGDYRVYAYAPEYGREFYNGTHFRRDAQPVSVIEGQETPNINFSLGSGGSISGTITSADSGMSLSNVSLFAIFADGNHGAEAGLSDENGNYTIIGLPYSTYKVLSPSYARFGSGDDNYIMEFWQEKTSWNDADIVTVAEGTNPMGINFTLEVGGSLSGTVLDRDTGGPVDDASRGSIDLDVGWHKFVYRHQENEGGQTCRAAFKAPGDTEWRWFSTSELEVNTSLEPDAENGILLCNKKNTWDYHPENHGELVACVDVDSTEESGWYGCSIVDAVNQNENIHGNDDYYTSYYEGYFCVDAAGTWQFSTDSDDASEIVIDDQVVAYWYKGHGSADRWEHKMEVSLHWYDTNEWVKSTCGDAGGNYTFENIPIGSYRVEATAPGYATEFFEESVGWDEAIPVVVTASNETQGINFTLEVGGTISGYVYQEDGVTPLPNVHVYAEDYDTDVWVDGTNTDQDGYYTLVVPTGTYRVRACPSCNGINYVSEWYNDTYDWDEATAVSVTAPDETTGINFTLGLGGTISGYVFKEDGVTPLPNVHVYAEDYDTDAWMEGTDTDQEGYYSLVLPTGTYQVCACGFCCSELPYADECYDEPVPVTVPNDTPNINFTLVSIVRRATIEDAIADGVAWLAAEQNPDGSWGSQYQVAKTSLAVLNLETHATEIGYSSPFNSAYNYSDEIESGLNYLFSHAHAISISNQIHDGIVDNPDTNGNGTGIYFRSPNLPPDHGCVDIYETSIAMMGIAASTDPTRVVNVTGSAVDGWTYEDVLQDTVDYIAWSQTDSGFGRGGWNYEPMDNSGDRSDQSNSGWVTLGLAYAEAPSYGFELAIPGFVRSGLDIWIDYIQNDVDGDTNDGGSDYTGPSDPGWDEPWVNILKTGNLLQQMHFVGDTATTQRAQNATDYIVRHWNDDNGDPGWRGCPTCYHATYTTMKGLEALNVTTIGSIDWFQDFTDALLSEQAIDGWWMVSCFDDGEGILSTEWALLTLQKKIPQIIKPDLTVLDKHEEWVDEGNGTYSVFYTVKNRGNMEAPAGHNVSLTEDGAAIEQKTVPVSLAPAATYSDSFDTVLSVGQEYHKIMVCADSTGMVDELNEDNNCLSNVWPYKVHNIDTGLGYSTIQAAIDAPETLDEHTISVDSGTYNENVVVNKQVTIRSTSGNSTDTIVQAANADDHVFKVTADYVNISGFTLEGSTGWVYAGTPHAGIYINADYCNISNNNASNNWGGILLYHSNNNIITNNTADSNTNCGIILEGSSNATLSQNRMSNSSIINLVVDGHIKEHYNHSIDTTNLVNGKQVYYYFDKKDQVIENLNAGSVILAYCSNFTISNNDVSNGDIIWLISSNYNAIMNNNASNNAVGIALDNSSYNKIEKNIANNNTRLGMEGIERGDTSSGIGLSASTHNIIMDNKVSNNILGISLNYDSINNNIINNTASSNNYGIFLDNSSYCNVENNIANNNTGFEVEDPLTSTGILILGPHNIIRNNNASNNVIGIGIFDSGQNTLTNNSASNNTIGMLVFSEPPPDPKPYYNNSIDTSNLVNGRPVYYYFNEQDLVIDSLETSHLTLAFCDNCTVKNSNISNGDGIFLVALTNSSVTNNTVSNNFWGILLGGSQRNNLTNNDIFSNSFVGGIYLGESSFNNIASNNVSNNYEGGIMVGESSNDNTITNNIASNNGGSGIFLASSSVNTITGNTATSNNESGIELRDSCSNIISDNTANKNINHHGIRLDSSSNNTLKNNKAISNKEDGICLDSSSNNTLTNNTVSKNGNSGIHLHSYFQYSSNNIITNSNASNNNDCGIHLYEANSNIITDNILNENGNGIRLYNSSRNQIYHNNFINNVEQARDEGSDNSWNNSYPSGGNYWRDYTGADNYSGPKQDRPGSDGIGDTPYNISGEADAQDRYPLMHPTALKIRIGYQPSTHQLAHMTAMEKGWWKENLEIFGVEKVTDQEFPYGMSEMQAMLNGEIDIAYVGVAPFIAAIDDGLDAKIVAGVQTNGSHLVLRPEINYASPEDLRGLKIATFPLCSVMDIVLKKWLMDNGLDPNEDLEIIPMGREEAIKAIENESVDGIFLPHPAPAMIELNGSGRMVIASGEMWPNHACCCLVVSGKLIREHPEMVKQLIKTHIKATEYNINHQDEAAEIYTRKTGMDLEVVNYSLNTWDGAWVSDPYIGLNSTLEYAEIMYELGCVNKFLTKEDLFDFGFYEKIITFDTGPGTYPRMMGTHEGIITPSAHDVIVDKMHEVKGGKKR